MDWATAAGLLILAAAATAVAAWAQVMLGEILADRARDELLDVAVEAPDALGDAAPRGAPS